MAYYKRINGDYTIQTLNTGGKIDLNTSNVLVAGNLAVSSNVSIGGNLSITGNVLASIVTAGFFFGDGRFLGNVSANIGAASILQNGTSNVNIPIANGNIIFGVNFIDNVAVVSTQGLAVNTETVSTSNVTGAIQVAGGVGVAGNVYADAVFSNNLAVLNVNSVISGGTY
jgi:hypothetical protein